MPIMPKKDFLSLSRGVKIFYYNAAISLVSQRKEGRETSFMITKAVNIIKRSARKINHRLEDDFPKTIVIDVFDFEGVFTIKDVSSKTFKSERLNPSPPLPPQNCHGRRSRFQT